MPLGDPTYIGQIASVTGAIIRVRLREDMPSTLVMIGGESYRVGQIGGFFRVPLGYTNLYAVCTQIGADAAPPGSAEKAFGAALEDDMQLHLSPMLSPGWYWPSRRSTISALQTIHMASTTLACSNSRARPSCSRSTTTMRTWNSVRPTRLIPPLPSE
jgi:hypothetical protein